VQSLEVGFVRDDEFCFLCRDNRMEIWNHYSIPGVAHVFIGPHIPGNFLRGEIGRGGQFLWERTYGYGDGRTRLLNQYTYQPAPGETLAFNFNLWDQDGDTGWDFDYWCIGRAELAARSAIEWQRIHQDVVISDNRGEASCRFVITVRGSPSP
jgi:hypothetical protein